MTNSIEKTSNIKPIQSPSGDVLIYEYGIRLDKDCLDAANTQINQARRLYNEIVASVRGIASDMRAFVLDKAGAAAQSLQAEIDFLTAQFDVAKADNNEESMKIIAQERRLKWRELADILKVIRKDYKTDMQQLFFSRIGLNSTCDTYKIRSQAVADGLGWATANAVLDAALIAWKKSFVLGRAPRFAAGFDKTQDTLTLQFTKAGGVAVQTMLEGGHGELSLLPTNGCGRRKYGEFRFRLGAAKASEYASGTWQYHRPLPPDAHIGLARLVRRRIGKDFQWAIQLMVKKPQKQEISIADKKPLVSVHFGWSADVSGRRVAGIADSSDPESSRILQLPPSIEGSFDRAAAVQSERDLSRDAIVPMIKELCLPESATEHLVDALKSLRRLPTQYIAISRLHQLCRLMRENDIAAPDWLEEWRKKDRMQLQSATHMARSARFARRDFYRETAAKLARQYGTIALEPLDLKTAAIKVNEVSGAKTEFAKKARAGRVVAAISELESAIRWAASKNGSALIEVGNETVAICGICGGTTEDYPEDGQLLQCNSCGAEIDRKKNGAAISWARVNAQYEDVVTQYWLDRQEMREKTTLLKADKLMKMSEGRRNARTSGDGESADDSRTN